MTVRFNTATAGTFTGTFQFTSDTGGTAGTTTDVPLTGMAGVPTADITPTPGTPEDLGQQSIGGAALTATFTITNNGTGDLTITDLSITGADYSLTAGAVSSATVVTMGNTHVFTVEFDDTTGVVASGRTGAVNVTHDATGSPVTINFTAEVIASGQLLPLQPTATMTQLTAVSTGSSDDGQYDIDVTACPFPFNGTTFDRVSVSTNGYIRFGNGSFPAATGFSDSDTFVENAYGSSIPQVSFLAEDCAIDPGTTNLFFEVDTTNSRIVIRFEDFRDLAAGAGTGYNRVQIILFCSGGGNIQLSYYNCTFENNLPTWSIGV